MPVPKSPKRPQVEAQLKKLGHAPSGKEAYAIAKKNGVDPATVKRWAKALYPPSAAPEPTQAASEAPPKEDADLAVSPEGPTLQIVMEEVPPEKLRARDTSPLEVAGSSPGTDAPRATLPPPPLIPLDCTPIFRAINAIVNANLPPPLPNGVAIPPIGEEGAARMGEAAGPVVAKYLPKAAEYSAEINLAFAAIEVYGPFVMAIREYRATLKELGPSMGMREARPEERQAVKIPTEAEALFADRSGEVMAESHHQIAKEFLKKL